MDTLLKVKYLVIGLSSILAVSSPHVAAETLHFSPEIKTGPYVGSGLSGYGFQLGARDVFGLESLYLSYSDTNAELLNIDKDRITTYRVGGQIKLMDSPRMSLQVEAGYATYEGERDYIIYDKRSLKQEGVSTSASWVMGINQYTAFRVGIDMSYLDKSSTFLTSSFVPTFSTGLVVNF